MNVHRRTIKNDLTLSYILIILAVMLIMGGLSLYQAYHYTVNKNRDDVTRISEQAYADLQILLEQVDMLQYQAISQLISIKPPAPHGAVITKEYLDFYKTLEAELMTLRRAFSVASNLYWLDEQGFLCSSSGNARMDDFSRTPWIRDLKEVRYDNCFVGPHTTAYLLHDTGEQYVYTYAKNVYNLMDVSSKEGILQIDIPYEAVSELLRLLSADADCLAILTNERGEIIWFPEKEYLYRPLQALEYGWFRYDNAHESSLLHYELHNGWQLTVTFNNRTILQNILDNMPYFLGVIGVIIILSIFIPLKFSSIISRPLLLLTHKMKEMEEGQLGSVTTNSRYREIQTLEHGYNSMVGKLDDMMEKMVAVRSEFIQARLSALQMQINPHFLSNCFDMIRGLAVKDGNAAIESVADSLAMMYRYIIEDGDTLVTLSEELDHVKNYIHIQEARFGRSVQVLYHIEKETLPVKMPRLLLQPIVENAFVHGLEGRHGAKWIMITSLMREGRVHVQVRDNGIGISEARLRQLREEIAAFDSEAAPGDGCASIGLRNVNHRLYLHYGADTCITMESTEGEGTCVSFMIGMEGEPEKC